MDDIILKAVDVTRDFELASGTVNVLKGISVDIPRSRLTILRGRSGSGKTTLINSLGALDRPTSGAVYFEDRNIAVLSEAERDLIRKNTFGFVFQSTALIGMMTAAENVDFSLRISGMKDPDKRKARVNHCLGLVDMLKRATHMPSELSGGEQQRIAIARAMAHSPKIIFADEPTGALDTQMGLQVMSVFKLLIEREGITVVMATHDPGIMEIADCVCTLEDGVITDEQEN